MRPRLLDGLLLGAALLAALGSFAWYVWPARTHGRSHRTPPTEAKTAADYTPARFEPPVKKPGEWASPRAQVRGPEWIYDVFTPPEVFYDAATLQFAVSCPRDREEAALGLKLLAVHRTPFRLQLVGFVGETGRSLGMFENELTGEMFLAGAGRALPALGLVVTNFAVERKPVALADRLTSNQWVATAVVRDDQTGEVATLTAGERQYTGELRAVLAEGDDGEEDRRELRQGDEVRDDGQSYVIDRLQLDPPKVELTQLAPSAEGPPVHLSLTRTPASDAQDRKPADPSSP
jgi:hypothetical protein